MINLFEIKCNQIHEKDCDRNLLRHYMKEVEKCSDSKEDQAQYKTISLLPGTVEDVNVKMNVTKCSISPAKGIRCRKIWCLLSPFAWDEEMHPNCS